MGRSFIQILMVSALFFGGCSGGEATRAVTVPAVASVTAVPSKTLMATATVTSTPTLQPTLSAIDSRQVVESLLVNNGNCRLPCILGLNNGDWTGQTLHPFFSKFGDLETTDAKTFASPNRLMAIFSESDNLRIRLDFYVRPSKLDQLHLSTLPYYEFTDNEGLHHYENTYGNPTYNQLFKYYMLPQILTNYGPPTQVLLYVYTQDNDPMLVGVFRYVTMILYYQQKDFWIEYYMPRESVGNYYTGCPVKSRIEDLTAFLKPQNNMPFLDQIEFADVSLPIEDATGMTVDEFYQNFREPENTACIKTPMELWQIP